MTENTYYKPRLVIGDKEITKGMSGSINFSGNSQANSCTCKITDPEFQNYKLFNKELKVYLNYGSDDGIPIFRGFIKEIKPNDKETNIVAIDPRMLITGTNSRMVELTDDDNYDGYTLASFLYAFIDNKVNTDDIYIGLDALRDTNPIISMKGERTQEPTSVYDIVKQKLKTAVDDAEMEKPLTYFIDMIDDGKKNNITIVKEKQITDSPSLYLSYSGGLISCKYNRRAPATHAIGGGATFQYGNKPSGSVGLKISGDFKDKNEARTQAINEILLNNREINEINVEASKGHYISIGSIVRLSAVDTDIDGNHRLTSKKLSFNDGGVKLSLQLNKKPLLLSSYIQ
jgi:hypothetical protein